MVIAAFLLCGVACLLMFVMACICIALGAKLNELGVAGTDALKAMVRSGDKRVKDCATALRVVEGLGALSVALWIGAIVLAGGW